MTSPESDPGIPPDSASSPPASDPYSFPPPGSDPSAFPQPGYPQPGYPQPGYPQPGYPQPGYNQGGFGGPTPGMPYGQPVPGMAPPDALRRRAMQQVTRALLIGVALFLVGLVITIVTYGNASSSPSGGTYIVAWGPMLAGVVTIIRALVAMSRLPRR